MRLRVFGVLALLRGIAIVTPGAAQTPPMPAPPAQPPRDAVEFVYTGASLNEGMRALGIGSVTVVVHALWNPDSKPGATPDRGTTVLLRDTIAPFLKRFTSREPTVVIDSLPRGEHRIFVTAYNLGGADFVVPVEAGCRTIVDVSLDFNVVGVRVVSTPPQTGVHRITGCTKPR